MKNNMIIGDMFIVPNMPEDILFQINESLPSMAADYIKRIENLTGKKVDIKESMVQIWVTSPDSDNWTDHGHPELKERFTKYLPASVLKDVKEGDVLHFNLENKQIELKANQLGYRYARFGKFEDVYCSGQEAWRKFLEEHPDVKAKREEA